MNVWAQMGIVIGALWLIPAAFVWRLLRINHRGTTLRAKLVMAGLMFTWSVCAVAGGAYAAWATPRRLHFADYLALSLWIIQAAIWTWLCRLIVVKLRDEARSGKAMAKGAPTFFWQGLLIMVPVVVLACLGLASLKQDALAAEREERNRAAQTLDVLALAVRTSVGENLEQFLMAQNGWMSGTWYASQPMVEAGSFPDENLRNNLAKWEQSFPGLSVAGLATPECQILTDGTQVSPPAFSDVPAPPKWYLKLTPAQRELWEALRKVEMARSSQGQLTGALSSATQAFVNSHPPEEVNQIAAYLADPPEWLAYSDNRLPETESGLPLQDLACYRLLTTNRPPISNSVLAAVWKRVIVYPSFAAPALLDKAESLTNGADAVVCARAHWMREYWGAQERARAWLEPLRQLPGLGTNWGYNRPWSAWTSGMHGDALAVLTAYGSGDNRGYRVVLIPRKVIEGVFAKGLAENRSLIPAYASAEVTVDGEAAPPAGDSATFRGGPFLASVNAPFGNSAIYNGSRFELTLRLRNRDLMLSAARARALRFGWLIAAAVAAANIGFFAARRAFFRQLRLNEMKSDFVSSVSHELRAPIASVRLMAEGLECGRIAEPEKQREYFKFIVQECRRLSSLIENVLDFSRIEQGRKQYELESTDLPALAQQTVKVMETYAAERGVGLSLRTTGDPVPVNLDGKAVQQALVNLIDNAIKHSPKGSEVTVGLEFSKCGVRSAECRIEERRGARDSGLESSLQAVRPGGHAQAWTPTAGQPRSHERSHVRLWVEDHGEGIAASEHEKIFERFYRVGSELRRETQGVGIGLSIVKHIVEAHGGRVTVRSAPGQGSRFTIELPCQLCRES